MRQTLRERFGGLGAPFWVLQAGLFLNRSGQFVQPLLTFWLTTTFGLSVTAAGAVVATYGLGAALGATLGGVLADRYGRRVTLLASAAGAAVAAVALAQVHTVPGVVVGAFALAFANDLHRPAVHAMIADLVPPHDRVRAFSLTYVTINLGFAVAPALAGLIAGRSYPAAFVAAAATQAAWAAFVVLRIRETRPAPMPGEQGRLADVLADRVFVRWLFVVWFASLVPHQGSVALSAWMKHQGLSAATFGAVVGLNGLLIVLVQPWLTAILSPRDPPRALAFGAVLQGVGFAGHGLATGVPGHIAALVVWTVGEMVMSPFHSAIVARMAPTSLRARYQGLMTVAFSTAGLFGPLVGGAAIDRFGAGLWAACAVVGVVAAAGYLATAAAVRARLAEPTVRTRP